MSGPCGALVHRRDFVLPPVGRPHAAILPAGWFHFGRVYGISWAVRRVGVYPATESITKSRRCGATDQVGHEFGDQGGKVTGRPSPHQMIRKSRRSA